MLAGRRNCHRVRWSGRYDAVYLAEGHAYAKDRRGLEAVRQCVAATGSADARWGRVSFKFSLGMTIS